MRDIDNINHVGMAVRDLAATASHYERLGFTLTPFSLHSGAWTPNAAVQPMASGNRCIMFADNYLEILASEDPAKPSPRIDGYLKRHQGAHIICFNSENIEAVDRRLRESCIRTSGVIPLQRDIDTPDGLRTAKFLRAQFAPDDSPEGFIQAATHLTPEFIYQPRYTAHPNGCERLRDVILLTDQLDRFVAKYRLYIDALPSQEGDAAIFTFPLGARLVLTTGQRAHSFLPGSLMPPLPAVAAVSFVTQDLSAQRQRLQRENIAFIEFGDRLVVPAEETSGVAFIFEAKR